MLRHCDAGIIGAGDADAFDHCLNCLRLTRLQKDLGASHAGRVLGDRHGVGECDLVICEGIKDENQSHDFGDACGAQYLVRIFFVENCSGGRLHKNDAGG